MKAYWTDDKSYINLKSVEELHSLMNDLEKLAQPIMLFLEHANRQTLVIGIGAAESVLTFMRSDGSSFHSIGNRGRPGTIKFWCRDQWDEFYAEMAVPLSYAHKAADWFFVYGDMASDVEWEGDW